MGTEIAISFSSLRTQLENERSSLYKIDENIKKIVQTSGRFADRFTPSAHYGRGGLQISGRSSFPESGNNYKNEDQFGKRKHETKTVFSRLSARVQDSDGEDDIPDNKRAKVPSAVCRELPTRAAVLRAQGDDEQARTRNRRIFGSLLGTLQKFKQEEIVLQTKEEKKAQVERKIEEQARLEKEREQKERKTLFAERESKKATIKALEVKMMRVQEFEKWEASQKCLSNFILTKTKPHIYWIPKKITEKAAEKLSSSRKFQERCMLKKRHELKEELIKIEQSCLRPRGPGTKENDPDHSHQDDTEQGHTSPKVIENSEVVIKKEDEDRGRKRNKFAMDVDDKEKEDSDGEDRHDEAKQSKPEEVTKDNKMDTKTEQETPVKTEETKKNAESSQEINKTNETLEDGEVKTDVDNSDHS